MWNPSYSQINLLKISFFHPFRTIKSWISINLLPLVGFSRTYKMQPEYNLLNKVSDNTISRRYSTNIGNQDKIRILVAEDSIVIAGIIRNLLLNDDYEIDFAENGKKAVQLLEHNHYNMILMDLMMPVMDGFEATLYIRNEMNSPKSTTPIIALVADMTKFIAVKCTKTGMNDYITKPFNENELITKITRYQNM